MSLKLGRVLDQNFFKHALNFSRSRAGDLYMYVSNEFHMRYRRVEYAASNKLAHVLLRF